MSFKRVVVFMVAVVGFIGSPAVRAEIPAAPVLWEGRIVGADSRPLAGEIVAYARPAGLGLDEGSAPLREITRTKTDGAGRYVLRSLHTETLRATEDQNGWTNVMVAAFGDDGSFNLAFDSLAWAPVRGFHAQSADDPGKGRWVTTPADHLASERGEVKALSADAEEDPSDVAKEHPPVMVLSNEGERRFTAQASAPKPKAPADRNCMALMRSEDLDVHFTKVGETHLERDWSGYFEYTSTRSTSFQVGVRQAGKGWSVGGSTSSLQNTDSMTSTQPRLPGQHMWTFAADLKYGHYFWRCYGNGDRWYDAESIQPYTWKGGIHQAQGGPEPKCNPTHTSPVPPNGGKHVRREQQSATYEGGVAVAGFIGSVTTTIARGVATIWFNDAPRERLVCGERYDVASTSPNRIRSLP